ncbi:MAG: hypothetical protein WCW31_00770 [Patescibacteria group bacterium]|jgi:hypothetical protein
MSDELTQNPADETQAQPVVETAPVAEAPVAEVAAPVVEEAKPEQTA